MQCAGCGSRICVPCLDAMSAEAKKYAERILPFIVDTVDAEVEEELLFIP